MDGRVGIIGPPSHSAGFAPIAVVLAAAEVERPVEAVRFRVARRGRADASPSLVEPLRTGNDRRDCCKQASEDETLHRRLMAERVKDDVNSQRVAIRSELEE